MGTKSQVDTGKSQRAVGYVRVSTQEQVASGAGLDVQRATITTEVHRRGWLLGQVFSDEGVSGKSLKRREGLAAALDQLRSGQADVLVVSKLDRLARSVIDFAGLLEQATRQGWVIVVLDIGVDMTTPHGRFIAHVMSASAQWERELIGLRTKEALAMKTAQGVAVGRPHSVPPEVVERIQQLRTGGSTYQAIADALDEDQVPTGRAGKKWYPATVRGVLMRRRATTPSP
jgi:DNA invertase Pin-like site-specific DNA recombinase